MKTYRVKWEEIKTMLVQAEDEDEATQVALDIWYEKATLAEQDIISVVEDSQPVDGEQIYSMDYEEPEFEPFESQEDHDRYMTRARLLFKAYMEVEEEKKREKENE